MDCQSKAYRIRSCARVGFTAVCVIVATATIAAADENGSAEPMPSQPGVEPRALVTESPDAEIDLAPGHWTDPFDLPQPSHFAFGESVNPARVPRAMEVRVTEFQGLVPGVSTADDVRRKLGESNQMVGEAQTLAFRYEMAPFEHVDVIFHDNVVDAVVVQLIEQFEVPVLETELQLEELEELVTVGDLPGSTTRLYPERGIVFHVGPPSEPALPDAASPGHPAPATEPHVTAIEFRAISAEGFVERAEVRFSHDLGRCLDDLDQALAIDPGHDSAHALKARALLASGRHSDALEAIDRAIEHEMRPQFFITRCEILAARGDYSEAVTDAKRALINPSTPPHLRALATCRLGDCVAAAPQPDLAKAVELHLDAIRMAHGQTDHAQQADRQTAIRVLVEAHLAAAEEIARGEWAQREEVVPQWLRRAAEWADTGVGREGLDADIRLTVCRRSLAACVALEGQLDLDSLASTAWETGRELLIATEDPIHRRRVAWELGVAMHHAMRCYEKVGHAEAALKCGGLAIACFAEAVPGRQELPGDSYRLGRLGYQIGAIHAVKLSDAAGAIEWYGQAIPFVEQPLGPAGVALRGEQGQTLVSMAVTYWAAGHEQQALRLTARGARLIEEAVAEGVSPAESLTVPYANLAKMHRHLGDTVEAAAYEARLPRLTNSIRE